MATHGPRADNFLQFGRRSVDRANKVTVRDWW